MRRLSDSQCAASADGILLNFLSSAAAALSLTTLYRSSQQSGKNHYDAGYDAGYLTALDDLLSVIQHGVSASTDAAVTSECAHENGMSIGRVMDWIEARSEAIRMKAKDQEDDEDDSEKKAGAPPRTPVEDNTPNINTTQVRSQRRLL